MYKDWSFVYSPHLSSLQILSLWNFVLPPAERYKILLSCRWSCTNMNWSAPFFSFLSSNSVNIYVGIGVPWLIDTAYNFFMYNEPLRIQNAAGLSFSLLVFFCTSIGCIAVLVLRRLTLKAELGGPRIWAWVTFVYFMLLWIIFVVLSSLRVSGIIW